MLSRVDVPVPGAPDSGDVVDKGGEFGTWLAERPETFWTVVVVIVGALIAWSLLKNPIVKGMVIGAIVLAVIIAAVK